MIKQKILIYSPSYIVRQGLLTFLKEEERFIVFEASTPQLLTDYLEQLSVKAIFIEGDLDNKVLDNLLAAKTKNTDLIVIAVGKIWEHDLSQHLKTIPLQAEKNDLTELVDYLLQKNKKKGANKNTRDLSDRELDILKKVALGLTNKEISEQLFISMHTVITHRKNITQKLGIKTIPGLTVYAIINGLITIEEANK